MTIRTYNARTLASEASVEDLMMQARKIKYDESLTTRIGRLRVKRCGSVPALTVAYAPPSDYDDEEVEAFYVELEKFFKKNHTFYKVIVGDFNAKIGPRRSPEELHIGTHGLEWNEQGERLSEFIISTKIIFNRKYCLTDVSVVPKFYTRSDHRLLRARFRFSRQGGKAVKFKKRRSRELEDHQETPVSGNSRADTPAWSSTSVRELPADSELAKLCRAAIKEDLKERRAEVLAEAAETGLSIRNARRNFANFKTKMTALRRPDETVTPSRRTMEKVINDFYSDFFDSHVHLPHAVFRRMDTSSPLFSLPRSDIVGEEPSHLQVLMQRIKPPLFWLPSWPPTGHIKDKTIPSDSVIICVKDVAVPSQTSFAHLLTYQGDTEPLPYGVLAYSIQTRNSGRPLQHLRFHYAKAPFSCFGNEPALSSVNSYRPDDWSLDLRL
ncbi:unnamed protein product [Heligmosomoides polygyrus]|uniref:Endo/exonuclease/phosphatase domain-containing protein n=1 Tax=Heligmosomoides polygyrus TaxID=6339 RepID=A0A183G026_HELPZ|nr:unnamed protein product [Heligmosomoides polygyrus]